MAAFEPELLTGVVQLALHGAAQLRSTLPKGRYTAVRCRCKIVTQQRRQSALNCCAANGSHLRLTMNNDRFASLCTIVSESIICNCTLARVCAYSAGAKDETPGAEMPLLVYPAQMSAWAANGVSSRVKFGPLL